MEPLRRPAEIAFGRDGQEIAKLPNVHIYTFKVWDRTHLVFPSIANKAYFDLTGTKAANVR